MAPVEINIMMLCFSLTPFDIQGLSFSNKGVFKLCV